MERLFCKQCGKEIRGMVMKDILYNLNKHIKYKHSEPETDKEIWDDMWKREKKHERKNK